MASYDLVIRRTARKELESLPSKDLKRIVTRIQGLAADPRPSGVEKLSGAEKYRVRQGDDRILYEIDDTAETVTIVKVAHRRDVYR